MLSKNDLIGADAWLRRNWYDDGCLAIDITGGYQFTRLDDSIVIAADTVAGPYNGRFRSARPSAFSIRSARRTNSTEPRPALSPARIAARSRSKACSRSAWATCGSG